MYIMSSCWWRGQPKLYGLLDCQVFYTPCLLSSIRTISSGGGISVACFTLEGFCVRFFWAKIEYQNHMLIVDELLGILPNQKITCFFFPKQQPCFFHQPIQTPENMSFFKTVMEEQFNGKHHDASNRSTKVSKRLRNDTSAEAPAEQVPCTSISNLKKSGLF